MSSKTNPTRTRILAATLELLESGGGNAVRMSDIAKAAKISRQALYLHFPNRAELLVATTRYVDDINDVDSKLSASRAAPTGRERLTLWVDVWGNYIPAIYGVAKALLAMKDSDTEAKAAWDDRMAAVRHGCAAAVEQLEKDGHLAPHLDRESATDFLWMLLSVRNWELLTKECGWTQETYIWNVTQSAHRALCT